MRIKQIPQHYPATCYFILTFFISWLGAFLLVAQKLIHGEAISKFDGILMFPIMLMGPFFSGIILTRVVDGKKGLQQLFSKMKNLHFSFKWFTALLLPPLVILFVLIILSGYISPVYSPNFFALGIAFGIPAGFFEEVGWTGFAFPKISLKNGGLNAAIFLGLLWGLWHLPAIDFLGAASPHGNYLLPFFLSFVLVMSAIRVLISWLYSNTNSILLAQLMHISSTGFLVMLSPSANISPRQETMWYTIYGIILWVIVTFVVKKFGKQLTRLEDDDQVKSA
jgi:membrane protease YdiL (CAAX protease family)